MDLHNALAALIRPVAIPGMLPFQSQLLSLAHMDTSHLLNMPAIPELTLTPKKSRLDDSSSPLSSHSSTTVSSTQNSSPTHSPRRKLPQPIPDERKDDAYFERRRKNNDAAKRSRDARRLKEDVTARRAQQLEQENAQLRAQIQLLKSELTSTQLIMLATRAAPLVSSNNQTIIKQEEHVEHVDASA